MGSATLQSLIRVLQQQGIMEEVLRRIYHINQRNIQRKRIEKALEAEHYVHTQRKKYDFREETTITTPKTILPFEDQIRFEKDLYQTGQRHLQGFSSISPRLEQFRLPVLTRKEQPRTLRRKFRGAVWAIVFLGRLEARMKESMLKQKRRAQKCYKHLLVFIQKLVRGYYQRQLREELVNYIDILQKMLEFPKMEQEKEVAQMLYYLSEKLSTSTVTKDILEFFVQSSANNSFPPSDYLSAMEIARLDFSKKYGCLIQVTPQQTRMLLGLGLGVKIFCFYVLYQPWKLSMATEQVISKFQSLQDQISNIASVFYFIILEQFCFKLKEVRSLHKSLIGGFSIRPISQLDPYGEGIKEPTTARALIANQNRSYLSKLETQFPEICSNIKSNLIKWISRVSYACMKQSQRKGRRQEESIYYKTIDKREEGTDRRIFKSLEMKRKKAEQSIKQIKKSLPLPSLKYTIQ